MIYARVIFESNIDPDNSEGGLYAAITFDLRGVV